MKLLRSELESEFKEKLFEINNSILPDRGIRFSNHHIVCKLTSFTVQFGFEVSGSLKAVVQYDCDRCLTCFNNHLDLSLKLCFTTRKELADDQELGMIFFPNGNNSIDISYELADLIVLDQPMKSLCKVECKGLCSLCGINLNRAACDCISITDYDN